MESKDPYGSFNRIAFAAGWLHGSDLDLSTFGNISIMHRKASMSGPSLEIFDLPGPYPVLIDSVLFITRTGSTMKEVMDRPLENIGKYLIDQESSMTLIEGKGPPSSEISSHLEIYRALLIDEMSILHFHDDALLKRISSLKDLPDQIRMIPVLQPGSMELARASGEAASSNRLLIWSGHGMTAISDTLENAVRIAEAAMAIKR